MKHRERYIEALTDVLRKLEDAQHSLSRLLALPALPGTAFDKALHYDARGVEWAVQLALDVLVSCAPHEAVRDSRVWEAEMKAAVEKELAAIRAEDAAKRKSKSRRTTASV